jgi:glucose 1-dehydrogenase
MEIRLDGKVALVTGASSGIGQGIAGAMAEAGADVVVNYHSESSRKGAEVTRERIEAAGRKALLVQGDLANRDAIAAMFAEADRTFGRLDILVNNAGIGGSGDGVMQEPDDWDRVIAVNLTAPFLCQRHAVELMRRGGEGGRVINITSVHEEAPGGGAVAYTATKGGLRNLTRASALLLAPEGIYVTNLAPGMILTKMNREASENPEVLADAEKLIPARRAGVPQDVASAAVFLASDHASYITGSTIFVDGGWLLEWPPV